MANLITTDDLKSYALWLSGEPTDGTSDYDERVLQHMQTALNTFVNGGSLGTRDVAQAAGLYEHLVDIPTTDWLWLRKFPPYAFNTTPAVLGAASSASISGPTPEVIGTVTLTNGSAAITFSVAPAASCAGWRLKLQSQAAGISNPPCTVPRISAHIAGATSATLDAAWPQDSQVASNFVLYKAEYALPADFVRFCESPMVQGVSFGRTGPQGRLSIGSYEQVMDLYPLSAAGQGAPDAAARLEPPTIMVNRWDTVGYRIEFSYIFTPDVLAVEVTPDLQEPLVPVRYRHVLAIGAAMLVMQDKVDSRHVGLASEFREIITHMGIEFRKEQNAGSELSGRHLMRQGSSRRGMLRTTSGIPLF